MSQALPVLPHMPLLDARKPELRPVEVGNNGNHQRFDKLLDRFVRQDTAKEPPREATPERRAETTDESEAGHADAEDALARESVDTPEPTADAAQPAELAGVAPAIAPAPAAPPAVVPVAAGPIATAAVVQPGDMPIQTVEAPAIAATALPMVQPQSAAAETPAVTGTAEPTLAPVQPGAATAAAQPMAADARARLVPADHAAAPAMPMLTSRIAAAVSNPGAKAAATKTEPTSTMPTADTDAAALLRAPMPQPMEAPVEPAAPTLAVRPDGKAKATPSAAPADPLAAAAAQDEKANKTPEQPFGTLLAIDTPRSAAAQYHKVAETVRAAAAGADTPSPADQVSIRLLHAVAEGKRTIQMHLHPAELGSIDVKMQWQGDRLTAQFQVDRPETLVLLQRDVPALERTLNQAGVNVDSGSLSFSLRQQTGNGQNGNNGQLFDPAAADSGFGEAVDLPLGDEPLGQVIRDGMLSIRV